MKNILKAVALIFSVTYLIGCSSTSHIVVGNVRSPIPPNEVKLYTQPPEKYDEIVIIESSSKSSMAITDQGKVEVAIQRLKTEAASLGANGILLKNTGDQSAGAVGFGSANMYGGGATMYGVSGTVLYKFAKGMAIYVYTEE